MYITATLPWWPGADTEDEDTTTSNSQTVDFSPTVLKVVPVVAGTITFELIGIDPSIVQEVNWILLPNQEDYYKNEQYPVLNSISQNPLIVTMDIGSIAQSFSVIAYTGPVVTAPTMPTQIQAVMNMVTVNIEIVSSLITTTPAFGIDLATVTTWGITSCTTAGAHAMVCSANVLITGGGGDCSLGLSNIKIGWNQTAISEPFNVKYPTVTMTVTVAPYSFPLLDSARINPGTGGDNAFLAHSQLSSPIPMPLGEMFTVSAWDTPGKDFDAQHPPGYDPIATSQGYVFTTYLACYSTDFSHTYVAAGKFDWSLDFLFNYSSLEWTYSSSTITAPSGTTNSGMPQNAHSSGAVTVAPALGRVQNHVYA